MLKKKLLVLGLILGLSISLQTMSYATENSISDMTSSEKNMLLLLLIIIILIIMI